MVLALLAFQRAVQRTPNSMTLGDALSSTDILNSSGRAPLFRGVLDRVLAVLFSGS